MNKFSKILISGLLISAMSPAAYAANTCTAPSCNSNKFNVSVNNGKICINGNCINSNIASCIPQELLNRLLDCKSGSCKFVFPDFGNNAVPEVTQKPEATAKPSPTKAPAATAKPTPTKAPAATAKPEATKAPQSGASVNASAIELEVFNLVNQVRAQNGLGALTWANDLANVARAHSQDMIDRHYFDHTDLDGNSPFDRLRNNGISYRTAAENIAYGQKTAKAVMDAWMNSSGHRANILNANVKEIGVGAATSSGGTIYWTQMFVAR